MSDGGDSPSRRVPVVETRFSSDAPPSQVLLLALAAAEGVEPIDLDPLYDCIDLEALDSLLGDPVFGDAARIAVEFDVAGHRVVVCKDGTLSVLDA